MKNIKEKTLVILKPDALQRGILGEIIARFEDKGIKLVGMKMMKLNDLLLDKHYAQHKGKAFLPRLKEGMKRLPVIMMVFEGLEVARVVRTMCGSTDGKNAQPGTIRGDYSMSIANTIVHSSEDVSAANREINIFFSKKELFDYAKPDMGYYYADDELA